MATKWTCKQYAALLAPYSEDALPDREAARVKAHVDACPACRAELATLREISKLLRAHKPPAPEPTVDLWSRIHARIAPAPARAPSPAVWWRAGLARPVVGLAAAALVIGAIFRPSAPPDASARREPKATALAPLPEQVRPPEREPVKNSWMPPTAGAVAKGREDPFLPAPEPESKPVAPKRAVARLQPAPAARARPKLSAPSGVANGAPVATLKMADNRVSKPDSIIDSNVTFHSGNGNATDDLPGAALREPDMRIATDAPAGSAPVTAPAVLAAVTAETARQESDEPASGRPQPVALVQVQDVPPTASAVDRTLRILRQRGLFHYSRR